MIKEKESIPVASRIALISVLTAVTTIFTFMIRIPIAPTRGYLNLGDVAIFFTALTFGPITALVTGGLGTALADLLAGYAQWVPITFFAHGVQGLAAGWVFFLLKKESGNPAVPLILAFILGTIIMAGTYLAAGSYFFGFGAAMAEVPGNILQNAAGILIGAPLAVGVKKAYPPVSRLKW